MGARAAKQGRTQVVGDSAADVAGYSRLMGLDEVGTARTLREHAWPGCRRIEGFGITVACGPDNQTVATPLPKT
jgi:hypothetical protein